MIDPSDDRRRRSKSCPLKDEYGDEVRDLSPLSSDNNLPQNGSDFSKAKVNRWVEAETNRCDVDDKEKLFCLPVVAQRMSDSVGTRPQTEPGKRRDSTLKELVKMATPQSSHDVTTSFPAFEHTTVKEDTHHQEDWVLVEKASLHVGLPSDRLDEPTVLIPSGQAISAKTNIDDDNERTRRVLSNKFGSTFKVMTDISESSTKKKETKITTQKKPQQTGLSLAHIGTFATAISKWKAKRAIVERKVGFDSLDVEHQKILKSEADTIKTEIPEAMMKTIKEEAYRIMLKATSAYRLQIGARHKLTREAYEYVKELREELHKP